jgi:hypothetical protein
MRSAATWASAFVRAVRSRSREPLPLGAQQLADTIVGGGSRSVGEAARAFEQLGRQRAQVSAGRRRMATAALLALPLIGTGIVLVGIGIAATSGRVPLDDRVAARALHELAQAERRPGVLTPGDRAALEDALATRYRAQLANPRVITQDGSVFRRLGREQGARATQLLGPHGQRPGVAADGGDHRALARRLLDRPAPAAPPPVPRAMQAIIDRETTPIDAPLLFMAVLVVYGLLLAVALVALPLAAISRGLLLQLFGFAIVTADGRRASRLRVLGRTAIAWSPLLAPALVSTVIGGIGEGPGGVIAVLTASLVVFLAGGVVAMVRPSRGIQDRLAGTWIVPR